MHGHHSFEGYVDSILFLDPETQLWTLKSYVHPETYAVVEAEDYPFGQLTWQIHNDPCYDGNVTEVVLSFNTCTDQEFNCLDGKCINISQRCNGRIDCTDRSDEIECELVKIDNSYIKEIPAPPNTAGQEQSNHAHVNVAIDIQSVLNINEVEGVFAAQFLLSLTWFDKRLIFNNLKEQEFLNTLTEKDKGKIWIPQVIFFNNENKAESLADQKAFVAIERKGSYTLSSAGSLENIHIYQGRENPLTIKRIYSIKFLCEYDMQMYPFDSQQCSIQLVLKGNTGEFAKLHAGDLNYVGPIDLTQYYIKDWSITEKKVPNNATSVEASIRLGRRILNEILTTYLPTILICIVSFSTNYFKVFFFEAIVTVNLTSMLVLTTLFISVSNSLPKTSYVKMIDIWLIAVLCVPFFEVILHTLMDAMRKDEKEIAATETSLIKEVLHAGKAKVAPQEPTGKKATPMPPVEAPSRRTQLVARNEMEEVAARREYYHKAKTNAKDEKIMKLCREILRKGLPAIFLIFSVTYFALGSLLSSYAI